MSESFSDSSPEQPNSGNDEEQLTVEERLRRLASDDFDESMEELDELWKDFGVSGQTDPPQEGPHEPPR